MASQPLQSTSTSQPLAQVKKLTMDDLAELEDTLCSVANKCISFGLQLGVKFPTLTTIQQDHGRVQDQLREILAHRLTQLPPLTWHSIVQALQSNAVQMSHLANEIKSQHLCQSSVAASCPSASIPSQPQAETAQPPSSSQPFSSQLMSVPAISQAMLGPSPQLSQDVATPHPFQVGEQQALHGQPQLQHIPNYQPLTVAQSHGPGSDCGPSQTRRVRYESPMAQYIDYVKTLYRQSVVEKKLNAIKWPPTPSTVYINLVCVDQTTNVSKDEADECTRAMVEDGNVDVILKKKRSIDFSDIANGVSDNEEENGRRVILVEGAPGVGKSTFSWEFCRRWEKGKVAQQYQLVLLLRLRDEKMSKAQNLGDLIYHPLRDVCQAVECELVSTHGASTLIILEGFDELPSTYQTQPSVFLQLIYGELLPLATVLVTSRPWATQSIHWACRHHIFQHIEILGFTSKQIEEYVTSVFTHGGKLAGDKAREIIEEVMSYIKTYPQIKACMYIPLNSVIVVSVYQESKAGKCILPRTMTELYHALVSTLLLRYLYGHPEYGKRRWKIQSLKDDLPQDVYSKLLAISELAYSGICTDQEHSVQLIFTNLPSNFATLGLMQSVPQLYVTQGEDMSHNFLHLTVQEFLAALHISNMSSEKQLEHFKQGEKRVEPSLKYFQGEMEGRWRVVLRFLAGITKLATLSPDLLRGLLLRNPNEDVTKAAKRSPFPLSLPQEKPDADQITKGERYLTADRELIIHHVHWLFEAQRDDIVSLVLQEITVEFMCQRGLTPLDYYSLGYCIVHSHSHWVLTVKGDVQGIIGGKVVIEEEVVGKEEVRMLVAGVNTRQDTTAQVVGLRGHYGGGYCALSISAEALNVFFSELKNLLHLQELHLNLPAQCCSIPWPRLSGLCVLHLGMKGEINWKLGTLLPHLSLESLVITVSSVGGGLGPDDIASIGKMFLSSDCPKHVDIIVEGSSITAEVAVGQHVECIRCHLDWYSVGYVIAHSNFQWVLTREKVAWTEGVIQEKEVRMLVAGINTRQDSIAKVVGMKCREKEDMMILLQSGRYCFLTISPEALNMMFVELKNVLHLQELHLNLPTQCSNIQWPNLSGLRVLGIGLNGRWNWRLDTVLPHLLLESLTIELNSEDGTVVFEDCVAIQMLLSSSNCLKHLHFQRSISLNHDISVQGMESITKAMSENELLPLRYFGVGWKHAFSDTAAHCLALFIMKSTTLHHLYLRQCTLSARELLNLSRGICHSSSLQEWILEDLRCTVDGDDEATQLSVDSQIMGCLVELTASNISDQGAKAFAAALSHSSTLKLLDLSGTDAITAEGIHHLVQALTVNTSIPDVSDLGRYLFFLCLAIRVYRILNVSKIFLRSMPSFVHIGDGLVLPWRCWEYATQCPQYSEVKDRIAFA